MHHPRLAAALLAKHAVCTIERVSSCCFSPLYRSMSSVTGMAAASATGTAGAYGLPYMTGNPTELTATPQQLWNAQGKFIVVFDDERRASEDED